MPTEENTKGAVAGQNSQPATATVVPQKGAAPAPKGQQPGQRPPPPAGDDFWRRYSPHHEFPLATASSVVAHMFVMLMVAMFSSCIFGLGDVKVPPELDSIEFGGGGGDPQGNSLDLDAVSAPPEAIAFEDSPTKSDLIPPIPDETTPTETARPVEKSESKVSELVKRAKGMGGTGSGGGLGSGHGTGIGSGDGPGRPSKRAKRLERWDIHFDYTDGNDYVNQLRQFGVILAVPIGDGKYTLYRDLSQRPPQGETVTTKGLSDLNRIWWTTTDPEAVASVLQALGLPLGASRFSAFFPKEFEADLLKKETAHSGGKPEEDIKRTTFKVIRSGRGLQVKVDKLVLK